MQRREEPAPGQESVWDYPRPPRFELSSRRVRVALRGETIAETQRAFRVLETSHPPTWYVPAEDIKWECLVRSDKRETHCEWKGSAHYWDVRAGKVTVPGGAWSYENPTKAFEKIRECVAFYPNLLDCYVDDEKVEAQAGSFYGGWITRDIAGPFKGLPGTSGW